MEYLITFAEGVISFISPCVLPVIPIYILYFAGEKSRFKKAIINALGFVLGFSIIFILLGVFASTFGTFIHKYSDYMSIIFGIFLILIGLNYVGLIFVKFLNKTSGMSKFKSELNFITAVLFGVIFSLSWTPCVGAFLSSALILASTAGSVFKGALLLLLYSLGLAIPFIITTLFLEKMKLTFDFIKKHYNIINKLSGSLLIIFGIFNVIQGILGVI